MSETKTNVTEFKILSIDDIEASVDVEYALVDGFKPGEKFRIQSLTAGDLIEWSEANEGEAKRTAGLRLIVKSLVDTDGKRIAGDKHIELFRKKSHKVTERIVKDILKLNDMKVKAGDAKND
jgi:hypothetical protein